MKVMIHSSYHCHGRRRRHHHHHQSSGKHSSAELLNADVLETHFEGHIDVPLTFHTV